jgi:hypothetical protein
MSFDAQRAMPERVPKRDFTEISSIAFCEQLSQRPWRSTMLREVGP